MNHALLALLTTSFIALADEKPKADELNARDTVEKWVAAALAGKVEEATPLADPNTSLGKEKGVKEFKEILGLKSLKVVRVSVSTKDGYAAAMSEGVKLLNQKPGKRDTGVISFKLFRVKDRWLLKDIDFDTEDRAREKIKEFIEKHADAEDIPVREKK
jgi:hypothetical protein